jgi:excinuclease ABC subunit C
VANEAGMNPGIYKMIDVHGKVIYVGKAKHLKNRLMSYTRIEKMQNRIRMMISNIHDIEIIVVKTEIEALLLESNLIKQLRPFYNILLKDDKTFPYIVIDKTHGFPRIFKYRTLKARGSNFFGPYPAISALDETLNVIQKVFLLRNCTDNYFDNRKRPCLQFFIKRCSAPCMGRILEEEYAKNVRLAEDLLRGKDEIARNALISEMKVASESLDFERAALIRDRIVAINKIQSKQYIQITNLDAMDFVAVAKGAQVSIVYVSFFRLGKNVGSDKFTIQNSSEGDDVTDILESFIMQFYSNVRPPSVIVTSHDLKTSNKNTISMILGDRSLSKPPESDLMEGEMARRTAVYSGVHQGDECKYSSRGSTQQKAGYGELGKRSDVKVIYGKSGDYIKIIDSCLVNAQLHLKKELTNEFEQQLSSLKELLGVDKIDRIEAFDNSHIQGTNACGVMIVFENGKIQKDKARSFNIQDKVAHGGDDIGMMQFVLEKRFKSNILEIPDVILIDGCYTQLSVADRVLENYGLTNKVKVIGIAKQNNRKIGYEKVILGNNEEITFGKDDELLSFLIMLRNEAHRKAITFHRKKRSKSLVKSVLDDIPSIGDYRRKRLLEHFGSVDLIKKASIEELKMVKGIDTHTAQQVFYFFNKGTQE